MSPQVRPYFDQLSGCSALCWAQDDGCVAADRLVGSKHPPQDSAHAASPSGVADFRVAAVRPAVDEGAVSHWPAPPPQLSSFPSCRLGFFPSVPLDCPGHFCVLQPSQLTAWLGHSLSSLAAAPL